MANNDIMYLSKIKLSKCFKVLEGQKYIDKSLNQSELLMVLNRSDLTKEERMGFEKRQDYG